jgi:hypothetical protein
MLNQLSNDIAMNFAKDSNQAFDPAMITSIIEIITSIIEKFKDCGKTSDQALTASHNPGLWERLVLRNTVSRYLGRNQFRTHGQDLIKNILKTSGKLTKDQMIELYSDVDRL